MTKAIYTAKRRKNLSGKKVGRLLVQRPYEEGEAGKVKWVCLCDCGKTVVVFASNLSKRSTLSCGCLHREIASNTNKTHGMSATRLYGIWLNIKQRCLNDSNAAYQHYGGRGVLLCQEWQDFMVFYSWAMTSGYSEKLSIERIDVNGNYEPSNCTWIPMNEQSKNRRCTTLVRFCDTKDSIAGWRRRLGIGERRYNKKIQSGLNPTEAIFDLVVTLGNNSLKGVGYGSVL